LIDNTGLQIRLSEAYGKLAKELGKAPNELTSVEQQMALLNATLEAGDILITQAGGNVESFTDVYAQFGANVEDAKNSFKGWFDLMVGSKLATGLNSFLFGMQDAEEAFQQTSKAVREAGMGYDAYIQQAARVALATGEITEHQYELLNTLATADPSSDAYKEIEKDARALVSTLGLATEAAYDHTIALGQSTQAYERYRDKILDARVAMGKISEGTAQQIRELSDLDEIQTITFESFFRGMIAQENLLRSLMREYGLLTAAEAKGMALAIKYDAVIEEEATHFRGLADDIALATKAAEENERSMLDLAGALKLVKTDEEKVRIATDLYGISVHELSGQIYEREAATLVQRMATENLTDAERSALQVELNLTLAKIAAVEASQKLTDAEQDLKDETRKLADEARNAKSAFQTMFEGMNLNLPSLVGGFVDDIKFFEAGGADLQKEIELVGLAVHRELFDRPKDALPIFEQLNVKAQALEVALGKKSELDAAKELVGSMTLDFDKITAQRMAQADVEKQLLALGKDRKNLTDEQLDKMKEEAYVAAVIGLKTSEAIDQLRGADDIDIFGMLADTLDPDIFLTPFEDLPDDLQELFESFVAGITLDKIFVKVVPEFDEEDWIDLAELYPDLGKPPVEGGPKQKPIPDDLIPLLTGEDVHGNAIIDISVTPDEKEQRFLDWVLGGETAEQSATVAATFAPALSSEMEKLLGDGEIGQSVNVAVSDDIQSDLNKLILSDDLYTTIHVTVITDDTSGSKATGGRITAGEMYQVGEIRPELFVSDTAGRMMMNTRNPYADNATDFATPSAIPIMQTPSISVAINNPVISNDFDLEQLSYQIARKISERQRGAM